MRYCRAWIVLPLVVAAPTTTRAQLAQGLAALERADFPSATAAFEAELASRSASRTSLTQAHRHLAMLRHVAGKVDRARTHARIALALDRNVKPPAAAGARVVALFQGERSGSDVRSLRFTVRLLTQRNGSSRTRLAQAEVVGAPRGLPLNLRLACTVGALHLGPKIAVVAQSRQSVRVAVPFHTEDKTHCQGRLQTPAGAVIETEEVRTLPTAAPNSLPTVRSAHTTGESTGSPWLWIAVGGGVAVAAAAIVVAVLLASGSDQAQLGPVEIVGP